MNDTLAAVLLVLFLAHLAAFAVLGVRRRQWYYLALVVTFSLLSVSFALRLAAPEALAGGVAWVQWTRWAAWASAAVSVSWTFVRTRCKTR